MNFLVSLNELGLSFQFDNCDITVVQISYGHFSSNCPAHRHGKNYFEIHLICEGSGELIVDNTSYSLNRGIVFTTGSLVTHEQINDPEHPMGEYCLGIEIKKRKGNSSILMETFARSKFWYGNDRSGNCISIFKQLENEAIETRIGFAQKSENLIKNLIIEMTRLYSSNITANESTQTTLDKRRSIIIDNVFISEYRDITEFELANRLAISPRQLQRFLKDNYGKTFLQMRQAARLAKAKELLKDNTSLEKVADMVGYSDTYYLRKMLR